MELREALRGMAPEFDLPIVLPTQPASHSEAELPTQPASHSATKEHRASPRASQSSCSSSSATAEADPAQSYSRGMQLYKEKSAKYLGSHSASQPAQKHSPKWKPVNKQNPRASSRASERSFCRSDTPEEEEEKRSRSATADQTSESRGIELYKEKIGLVLKRFNVSMDGMTSTFGDRQFSQSPERASVTPSPAAHSTTPQMLPAETQKQSTAMSSG